MKIRLLKSALVSLMVLAGALNDPAWAQSAGDVVDRIKARFDESGGLSANFRQTIDNSFGDSGQATVLSGSIVAGREGYRVEMSDQIVVTDEATTWVYLINDQQVIVNNYIEDDGSFSPNQFLGERTDRFDPQFAEETSTVHYVVQLTPHSPDSYIATATLWVRKTDYVVTRIDVIDVNGASIQFEMSNVDFNPNVTTDTFQFEIPEGVEVIDLR